MIQSLHWTTGDASMLRSVPVEEAARRQVMVANP